MKECREEIEELYAGGVPPPRREGLGIADEQGDADGCFVEIEHVVHHLVVAQVLAMVRGNHDYRLVNDSPTTERGFDLPHEKIHILDLRIVEIAQVFEFLAGEAPLSCKVFDEIVIHQLDPLVPDVPVEILSRGVIGAMRLHEIEKHEKRSVRRAVEKIPQAAKRRVLGRISILLPPQLVVLLEALGVAPPSVKHRVPHHRSRTVARLPKSFCQGEQLVCHEPRLLGDMMGAGIESGEERGVGRRRPRARRVGLGKHG